MNSYEDELEDKIVLITGGTGSLGTALTKKLLKTKVKTIRILSRNENKQVMMASEFQDKRLRFFVGDVRDLPRLYRAFEDVDIVFHAAALKHVPVIEYNPFEAVKTNVIGSENVIDACLHENVKKCVAISTDKAVSPLNTYGATKLLMEKLFVTGNSFLNPQKHSTKFITVRYGNVLGSSGSVVPVFINKIKLKQKISITDPCMTRFNMIMDDALEFILESMHDGQGSEVFIPKLKAYTIKDVRDALFELLENCGEENISIRPGEKIHEVLINHDELRYTWEFKNKYIIFNPSKKEDDIKNNYPEIKNVKLETDYSSDNAEKLSKEEIKKIITKIGLLN